jgi:hypothetical protein
MMRITLYPLSHINYAKRQESVNLHFFPLECHNPPKLTVIPVTKQRNCQNIAKTYDDHSVEDLKNVRTLRWCNILIPESGR